MIFTEAKKAVSLSEAARAYGFTPNRAGFICCPFHAEKTPSLKLYDTSYYCFGCGSHGSVIDFVGNLFNLKPLDAVKKLNEDFNLGLSIDRPLDREKIEKRRKAQEAHKLFEEWRDQMLLQLNAAVRLANLAAFPSLSPEEQKAVVYREALEAWADALQHGSLEEQIKVFRDREGVQKLCRMILNGTQTKSPAA